MVLAIKIASVALVTALSLCALGTVSAQTGPASPTTPAVTPAAPATAVIPNGLSEADLVSFLRSLDPNMKSQKFNAVTIYYLKVERDGWRFQLDIESHSNMIWVNTVLSKALVSAESLPAAQLARLLEENFKIGPTHFTFSKTNDNKYLLNLSRNVDRAHLTVAGLQAQLNLFCQQVRTSYPVWSPIAAVTQ